MKNCTKSRGNKSSKIKVVLKKCYMMGFEKEYLKICSLDQQAVIIDSNLTLTRDYDSNCNAMSKLVVHCITTRSNYRRVCKYAQQYIQRFRLRQIWVVPLAIQSGFSLTYLQCKVFSNLTQIDFHVYHDMKQPMMDNIFGDIYGANMLY